MLFANIKTEKDIEQLKRRIVKDPELSMRIERIRAHIRYPKDGVQHAQNTLTGKLPTKAELLALYREMLATGETVPNRDAELALRKIKTKSNSGIAVVSLLTKPFPCPGRCTYCPTEENMPKSYLAREPAAARALLNDFDPYQQITNRLKALEMNGHPIDKIEMIVIGGTWSFYHPAYQEEFLIGCYRACNAYGNEKYAIGDNREEMPKTAEERFKLLLRLQDENERARCRIVGLSIETRPDYVTDYEIVRLRNLGVTKVEIGVQHLDDAVLRKTKRDMNIARVQHATEKLRNAGFKVVYHMMPNLPGSTPERDVTMFRDLFSGDDFHPDMLKIYPCVVLEHSELYEMWKAGGFQAYTDAELITVMRGIKQQIPPYVRILRVYRDIPSTYIKAGSIISNLRQVMDADMKKNNWQCHCIRCREIREGEVSPEEFTLQRIVYRTKTGTEIFLSYERLNGQDGGNSNCRGTLVSFCRLRLPDHHGADALLPVLRGAALIRELHTYGRHIPIGSPGKQSQHVGFGRRLVTEAERIAREHGYTKMAIIAGVGVRPYYRKLGYHLEETYMVKELTPA